MELIVEPYSKQVNYWPKSGRHIMAQFDQTSVVVYQAFRPAIGEFAAKFGYFGNEFKLNRMSWIKPSFLWIMYRSGWGMKPEQETILAIWIKRSAFDEILANVVPSSYDNDLYSTEREWQKRIKQSSIRLQWDPDYDPCQKRIERYAIQLGLRGRALRLYVQEWIIKIENISEFVQQQYPNRLIGNRANLLTPVQSVYPVDDLQTIKKLGLSKN